MMISVRLHGKNLYARKTQAARNTTGRKICLLEVNLSRVTVIPVSAFDSI